MKIKDYFWPLQFFDFTTESIYFQFREFYVCSFNQGNFKDKWRTISIDSSGPKYFFFFFFSVRAHDQNLPIDSDVEHMIEVMEDEMEYRECKGKIGK